MRPSQMIILLAVAAQLYSSVAYNETNGTDGTTTTYTVTTTATDTETVTTTYTITVTATETVTTTAQGGDSGQQSGNSGQQSGNSGQQSGNSGQQSGNSGQQSDDSGPSTATETSTTTIQQPLSEKIEGSFTIEMADVDAFLADPDTVPGIKAAIVLAVHDPDKQFNPQAWMVSITLTKGGARRLGIDSNPRRLSETLDITFTITMEAGSIIEGSHLKAKFEEKTPEALAALIKEQVEQWSDSATTYTLTVSNIAVIDVIPWFTTTAGNVTTTDDNSFTRKQAAFTAAHAAAVLIGMVFMQ